MFNRNLKIEIGNLKSRIQNLEIKVKQLACPHEKTRFDYYYHNNIHYEKCISCNKILKHFANYKDCKKAEFKKLKKEVERFKKEKQL